MDNYITVVISTRNSEKYIEKSISSALSQKYKAFDVIFFDAESSDATYEKALNFSSDPRIRIFRNSPRKYQGENIRNGVLLAPPGSIIVTLDGDDWFPHENVLSRVNELYLEHDCWMTYGTYEEYPLRSVSHIYREYPVDVRSLKTFREYRWLASHLRTFRRELFLKIKEEDLKDPSTGDYFSCAPDLSFQFPMLEMCGVDKSLYVPDILYVYNVENPNNESKLDSGEIARIENFLRKKPTYSTISRL
jgi:glycosyltransferase involved in cell wall biosynthesis